MIETQVNATGWYLREWMHDLGLNQAEMERRTGWGKARTNDIYHGRTAYYRGILIEAAHALGLKPFELLLPPEEAYAIRALVAAVRNVSVPDRKRPA